MVTVPGNDIGGATFTIRPKTPGMAPLKVTARSAAAADAVIKELLIRPEGVARESVDNLVLSAGDSQTVDATIPSKRDRGLGQGPRCGYRKLPDTVDRRTRAAP